MKNHLLKLYRYNAWANRRVIGCIEQQAVSNPKILSIFGHLVSAQFIWLNRFKGLPKSTFLLWGDYSVVELKQMVEDAASAWIAFIEETESFERVLKYNNYVGDYYENKLEEIMVHLVNHGSYHRGQVALLLRQNGYEPINTDLITYERVISGQLEA